MTDVASKSCIPSHGHGYIYNRLREFRLEGVYCWFGSQSGGDGERTDEIVFNLCKVELCFMMVVRSSADRLSYDGVTSVVLLGHTNAKTANALNKIDVGGVPIKFVNSLYGYGHRTLLFKS